ncbi:Uncharacterized membrane protein [Actinopolyspora lacussalsi subsp. righensis]|uniref:Uncharacterized membrane protein n=1 Tax=Actinopolyspora righensis TaxID=995060 RepID=A0A1I7B480_9ACTN|nr:DMT family transporter [Actinopolyspora righensis]SFT81945.1 Uncharacterized membrane protein [Actinopolyspora righensis]
MTRRIRQRHESVHAHLYLLVTMIFFGSAFTSSKVVVSELPHEVAAALRFGGGTLVLLVLLGTTRGDSGLDPAMSWGRFLRAGAVGLLVVALPVIPEVAWTEVSASTWVNIGCLALGPTAVAYLCYYRALRVVSPSTSTVMMFTVPVFGTTCSMLFLGETFTTPQLVGALIMLAGALLAVTQGWFRAGPEREVTTASGSAIGTEHAESEAG